MTTESHGLFSAACSFLEPILAGSTRHDLADELGRAPRLSVALRQLRERMCAHAFEADRMRSGMGRVVAALDRQTRDEGFHVLNDWDGKSDHVNEHSIPVDVLDYIVRLRGDDLSDPVIVAILLDYYFVHLLELLSLRIWDEGDPDANLDRLGSLLALLQGDAGSGQPFVGDVDTLILIATSHFELHERGYALLLERVRALDQGHQRRIAIGHAASMGSHLRFGFEASYA